MYDVLIIGGGTAGLAAGLYAARYNLKTAIISKDFGGTGIIADLVDNWIGTPGVKGPELMEQFVAHVKEYKVPMITGAVTSVTKDGEIFTVKTEDGKEYQSKTIILTIGRIHRKLEIPGEDKYAGRGVHYCFTCDGPLYKDKILAVVGGSDGAGTASLFLADYGQKVYAIFRKDRLTAEPVTRDKVENHKDVELVPSANIVEILGDGKKVTSVKLDSGREIKLDGIFVEIGQLPLNEIPKALGVDLDARGYVKVIGEQETNIEGFYAAGDITDVTSLKQFITSASEGSIAAHSIFKYLATK